MVVLTLCKYLMNPFISLISIKSVSMLNNIYVLFFGIRKCHLTFFFYGIHDVAKRRSTKPSILIFGLAIITRMKYNKANAQHIQGKFIFTKAMFPKKEFIC